MRFLERGNQANRSDLLCMIKTCSSSASGTLIHHQIIVCKLDRDVVIGSALVDMYAKCGTMEDAQCLFYRLPNRPVVSWGALIAGHVRHKQDSVALELFHRLQLESIPPDQLLLSFVLKACVNIGALGEGKLIHSQLLSSGLGSELNIVVENTLIDLYAKWGALDDACKVFLSLSTRSTVSWSSIIAGCVHHGDGDLALDYFHKMLQEDNLPDKVTFLCILRACGSVEAGNEGRLLHGWIVECEFDDDVSIGSALIDMYAKCANVEEAHKVFNLLPRKTAVSWSALIVGYAEHGCGFTALEFLNDMQREGLELDQVTILCGLKACTNVRLLTYGLLMHSLIASLGFLSSIAISNSLVDMYAKCGSLEDASIVFDRVTNRTVVSWGAIISGYAQQGDGLHALALLEKMQQEGVRPNRVVLSGVVKACSKSLLFRQGQHMHSEIVKHGLDLDVVVGSSLIDMYARCGRIEEAEDVFLHMPLRNVVCWGAMVSGYVQQGHELLALELYGSMLEEGMKPSRATNLCCLVACSNIGSISLGLLVHDKIIRGALEIDVLVGNALLNAYIKGGSLRDACGVLEGMSERDDISWGTMIAGYVWLDNFEMAKKCLEDMLVEGIQPSHIIYSLLIAACSHSGMLQQGHHYFGSAREAGVLQDIHHVCCMVDLLARAGHLKEAKDLLESTPCCPDAVVDMALLTGCRTYGDKKSDGELDDLQRDEASWSSSNWMTNAFLPDEVEKARRHRCPMKNRKSMGRQNMERDLITPYEPTIELIGASRLSKDEDVVYEVQIDCIKFKDVFSHHYRLPFAPDCLNWASFLSHGRLD